MANGATIGAGTNHHRRLQAGSPQRIGRRLVLRRALIRFLAAKSSPPSVRGPNDRDRAGHHAQPGAH